MRKLLVRVETERDVAAARQAYQELEDLRCVWTQRPLRAFAVDHLIPYRLWFSNDLWNLLPTDPSVNLAKKDKLISRATLLNSRDLILHCWRHLRSVNARRFELELGRSLLRGDLSRATWEVEAFAGLAEAVETIALQRGVQRGPT